MDGGDLILLLFWLAVVGLQVFGSNKKRAQRKHRPPVIFPTDENEANLPAAAETHTDPAAIASKGRARAAVRDAARHESAKDAGRPYEAIFARLGLDEFFAEVREEYARLHATVNGRAPAEGDEARPSPATASQTDRPRSETLSPAIRHAPHTPAAAHPDPATAATRVSPTPTAPTPIESDAASAPTAASDLRPRTRDEWRRAFVAGVLFDLPRAEKPYR